MTVKALIVDDEPFVRDDLRHMLSVHSEITVTSEVGTIAEAKKQLLENDFDVVFLDIQLRSGTGFELIPFIDESVTIIFITAHDEYAVRAFEINALDYILKPVTSNRLAETLAKLQPGEIEQKIASSNSGSFKPDDRVFVKTDSGQLFVKLDEIIAIYSIGGNYVSLDLKNGEKLLCRKTFKEWETLLPESVFIRIHRSTIVNISVIERINYEKDGSCQVYMSGQEDPFDVSRRMVPDLKKMIKNKSS